jgi:hypothetical protein
MTTEATNGTNFESFREEWLEEVRAGEPSTTQLGHRFAHKLVMNWLDIGDDTSDDLVYCDGAGDGGIDIAYLYRGDSNAGDSEEEGHTWYLVQSKYGSAFQGTDTILREAQKVIDTLDGQRTKLSSLADGLREKLTFFRKTASPRDRIVLVFGTEAPLNEEQKRTLNDVLAMGRNRLGQLFDVDAVSIATIYQRIQTATSAETRISVPVEANMVGSGQELLVGSISLLSLYTFMKTYRDKTHDLDQLYEKNVRRFLGIRRKVNKAMQYTLENNPEQFGLFNNGITIVVSDFQVNSQNVFELTEPFVVNGCQTTRTIWEVFSRRLDSGGTGTEARLAAWKQRAQQGVVVAKIVKVGTSGELLQQEITRYTNSQNAVSEKDFLALTSDFKGWADQMRKKYHIFMETQRGEWDSRRALQKQNPTLEQFSAYANAFDLLKVYGSGWMQESGNAFGRNNAFLPKGIVFEAIFNNSAQPIKFGLDDLYAAYQLQQAADNYKFGRNPEKNSRRQTRFLYYQIVIALLKDVMLREGLSTENHEISRALLELFKPSNADALKELLDTAIQVVDEYLTEGKESTLFLEPAFRERYNNDLNSFLKWEQLGKSQTSTPMLLTLLSDYQRLMDRGRPPTARELIAKAIKP